MNQIQGSRMAMKILVVDDSEDLRQAFARFLESKGYEVLQARSGHQALEMLGRYSVDLIISDIEMPDGDGFTLLKDLRASIQNHPPVIFMSGNVALVESDLKEQGAAYFFSKPFNSGEVLFAISALSAKAA
jgi:DNA-binding response OmpR family regulator